MKLITAILVICVALLSHSAAAFLRNKPRVPHMDALAPAVDATTGVVANPLSKSFNPLKFMLASLGILVDHLMEGSRKCVAELGPEAMGALKALLKALTFFG
ncbi:secretoglobin family 3A member 1 isoform X1 [Phacochoerus africanus]|uniref:secretoglobin family 3A member 1 isoform X1 n=1 Tax=Phacochoerus africanus TaxID=41426 RepID=UPI001FD98BAE|nr:secretoglobin family 3A member 1 isoform X1 [Phacochoerus africanus]